MTTEAGRPVPWLARLVMGLILLACLGLIGMLIVGSFALVVAIMRWLMTVFVICPIT